MRSLSSRLVVVYVVAVLTACGGTLVRPPGGGPGPDGGPGVGVLESALTAPLVIGKSESAELRVRYHDGAVAIANGLISWSAQGGGSVVTSAQSATDVNGIAITTVVSGSQVGVFQVEARGPAGETVMLSYEVKDNPVAGLQIAGTINLSSDIELTGSNGGDIAAVSAALGELSTDPGAFLVDLAIDQIADEWSGADSLIGQIVKAAAADQLNTLMQTGVPGFDKIKALIDELAQLALLARKFRIDSELVFATSQPMSGPVTAKHKLKRLYLDHPAATIEEDLVSKQIEQNITISPAAGSKVSFGSHAFPLQMVPVVRTAIQQLAGEIDPTVTSMAELFEKELISCDTVGQEVANAIGPIDLGIITITVNMMKNVIKPACKAGLAAASQAVEDAIANLVTDTMTLEGDARPQDSNGDMIVDKFTSGAWYNAGTFVSK